MPHNYCVYIMSSRSKCRYTGVTNNRVRRWREHHVGKGSAFGKKYRIRHLVQVEEFARPADAIAREKRLKKWLRKRKTALIHAANPGWTDLAVRCK